MKRFTFKVGKSVVYETTEPNRVSKEDIIKRYKEQHGRNLTMIPGIEVHIVSIPEEPEGGNKLRRTVPKDNLFVARRKKEQETLRRQKEGKSDIVLRNNSNAYRSQEKLRRLRDQENN